MQNLVKVNVLVPAISICYARILRAQEMNVKCYSQCISSYQFLCVSLHLKHTHTDDLSTSKMKVVSI